MRGTNSMAKAVALACGQRLDEIAFAIGVEQAHDHRAGLQRRDLLGDGPRTLNRMSAPETAAWTFGAISAPASA